MEVVSGSAARNTYYDRNPAPVRRYVGDSPGAAALAIYEAWTYTVPAGKKFYLEAARAHVENRSATVLNGLAMGIVEYLPQDVAGENTDLARAILQIGQASTTYNENVSGAMLLAAGDRIRGRHQVVNNAVGSDVIVLSSLKGVEFDA